jgi:hypothetical protein
MKTQGAWRISGYSADSTQFVSLVFNGLGIEGSYSIVEMSPDYSYVVTDITWAEGEVDSYNYFEVKAADLTATLNETDSVVTVTGTVLTQDRNNVPQFTVRLSTSPAQQAIDIVPSAATATKRLEDGELIIEKNGVKYTITGSIIR